MFSALGDLPFVSTEERQERLRVLARAQECARELEGFFGPGGDPVLERFDEVDAAELARSPERYRLDYIRGLGSRAAQYYRVVDDYVRLACDDVFRAVPPQHGSLDAAALDAHVAWLTRGRSGAGRLDCARGERTLDAPDAILIGALLDNVTVSRARLPRAQLRDAEILDSAFNEAIFAGAGFERATIRGGRFVRAVFAAALIDGTLISSGDYLEANFERAQLAGSVIRRARFERARFMDARITQTKFTDCNLRGAQFGAAHRADQAVLHVSRFEGCDLRDTNWRGRHIHTVDFVRCQLRGAHGRPAWLENVNLIDCDVTLGDLSLW